MAVTIFSPLPRALAPSFSPHYEDYAKYQRETQKEKAPGRAVVQF